MTLNLKIGISPCPNDTYIFHALLHGLVMPQYPHKFNISYELADVEKLNAGALAGALPITKLSLGVVPHILDRYALLNSGAALGWGCGPLVVAKNGDVDLNTAKIAIPGRHTTASMLLDLHGGFGGERVEMLFSDIMPAIACGEIDAGVIIHEGRFTYDQHGLAKLLDLGEWWESQYHLPLPLGAIAVRRDVEPELAHAIQTAIAQSLAHARSHPEASAQFIRANAQELNAEVTADHIRAFVTDFSLDLGQQGRNAILKLLSAAPAMQGEPLAGNVFLTQA